MAVEVPAGIHEDVEGTDGLAAQGKGVLRARRMKPRLNMPVMVSNLSAMPGLCPCRSAAGRRRQSALVLFVDGFGHAGIFAVDEAYSLPMTPWSSVNSMTICVARSALARSDARCSLASSRPRSSL